MPQRVDYMVEDMEVLQMRHGEAVNPEERTKDFRNHYRDKQVCVCIC
jgi:hypothetical protein